MENLNNIYSKIIKSKIFIFSIFIILYFTGLLTYQDYGVSVDEVFERASGFYWLSKIFNNTEFTQFNSQIIEKSKELLDETVPNPSLNPFYGIIFSLPMAFFETLLKIEDPKNIFYFYHLTNFHIFFFSVLYFWKILKKRFIYHELCLLGTMFYILSPRIYAHSFFNNKDIIFLSFATVSIYYCLEFLKKQNYKNLILFSFFSAVATASRILGFFFLILFVIFLLLPSPKNEIKLKIKTIIIFFLGYFLTLYICWPAIWFSPLSSVFEAFQYFLNLKGFNINFLFNGEYINSALIPYSYIFYWVGITTPLVYLGLFILGYFYVLKRFFLRLASLKEKMAYNDFWRGANEKKDLFLFLLFSSIILSILGLNISLYTGWRQLYFLNIFIIYFAIYGLYRLFLILKYQKNIKLICISIFLYLFFIINNMMQMHPFQHVYFNSISRFNLHEKFEIDYWGLSGVNFLKKITQNYPDKNKINIASVSWTPLQRSKWLLDKKDRDRLNFVGNNFIIADFIYDSKIYNVNPNKTKKHLIPDNFSIYDSLLINNIKIYDSYKKTKF